MDGILTLKEAARLQNRTVQQLRTWVRDGLLPAIHVDHNHTFVRVEDVKAARSRIEREKRTRRGTSREAPANVSGADYGRHFPLME